MKIYRIIPLSKGGEFGFGVQCRKKGWALFNPWHEVNNMRSPDPREWSGFFKYSSLAEEEIKFRIEEDEKLAREEDLKRNWARSNPPRRYP